MTTLDERAAAIATEHAKNAASWVFDGNTDDSTYRKVLQGIEDCDPEVMDAYRVPDLSGEFADEYTDRQLARDLDLDEDGTEWGDACMAYLEAASEAFWTEVERMARHQLS